MISRNGVCYNLGLSEYRTTHNGLTFVFSSQLHLDNFEARRKEHAERINESLSNRFNCEIDVEQLADVVLYRKIETRGFLIECREVNLACQNAVKFGGIKAIPKRLNAR